MLQSKKQGSVLPAVLAAVLLMEVLLLGCLQMYRSRAYAYNLLTNHYQSQALLSLGAISLSAKGEQGSGDVEGVLNFNIGEVTFVTADYRTYSLQSRLRNGYEEGESFTVRSESGPFPVLSKELEGAVPLLE